MNKGFIFTKKLPHTGFTLAEVLITLGIIGIVAALTLPTLIQNHRKKEVVTKLEKIYSVMNQAVNLTNAEYGDMSNWVKDCGPSYSATCTLDEIEMWFSETIGKHIKLLKIVKSPDTKHLYIYLPDGSIMEISDYIYDIKFYINAKALENPIKGKNLFLFRFNPIILKHQIDTPDIVKYTLKKGVEPYAWDWDGTREGLLDKHLSSCKTSGDYCTKLIQYDGWKISDDYPIKF